MKILILGKHSRTGGAAIASYRLMKALEPRGVNVKMLVQEGGKEEEGIHSTTRGWLKKKMNLLRFIFERLVFLRYERSRNIRFLFSLANTGEGIVSNPLVKEADIIHLHWINAGYLSLRSLRNLLELGKPLVWTFHDMWPFTGGCHYALDCKQYTGECGSCPYLKKPGKRDLSHRIWKKKRRLFENSQIHVITPSQWLGECVRESSLLSHWPISTIHNPIDHELYKPVKREEACRLLELDPAKKYILFGAANMSNMLKGFSYFKEAINFLAEENEEIRDTEILLFGKTRKGLAGSFPLPAKEFAFVSSTPTMIQLYSVAQLFVIPSLQDNLPNTILESLFCGTPVVGFRTGGIPEMILHLENGYLAEYESAKDLAAGMAWALKTTAYDRLSEFTRQSTLERFSRDLSVERHIELYQTIINRESNF